MALCIGQSSYLLCRRQILNTCSYKAANENKDASLSDKSWFKPFQFTSVMDKNMFCACDKIAYYLMCVVNICPAA